MKITCKQANVRYQWRNVNSLFMYSVVCVWGGGGLCVRAQLLRNSIVRYLWWEKPQSIFHRTFFECIMIKFYYKFMFAMTHPPRRNKWKRSAEKWFGFRFGEKHCHTDEMEQCWAFADERENASPLKLLLLLNSKWRNGQMGNSI